MIDTRKVMCVAVVGENESGKSVTVMKIIRHWKKVKPKSYKVVAFDPKNDMDSSLIDYRIKPGDKNWAYKVAKMKNILLVIDELRVLNKHHQPMRGWEELMAMRYSKNIDIIYIVHNPELILEYLTGFTNYYFIFYTNSKEGGFAKRIPGYMYAYTASKLVNNEVIKNGGGAYPNFPHVVFNVKKKKLTAKNFKDNKI